MKKIILFTFAFLLPFSLISMFGIYTQNKVFDKSILNYNYSFYLLGVSTKKELTVLGDNGWMFLGNRHNNVMHKSQSNYVENADYLKKNKDFLTKLSIIAKDNNLKFLFMVAPNKHSIYGEHIGLDSEIGAYSYYENNSIDTKSSLISYFREIKTKIPNNLFFKYDTHWNYLGAFWGYQYLMDELLKGVYNKIPSSYEFNIIEVDGGDLSRFLNIAQHLKDENPIPSKKIDDSLVITNLFKAGEPKKVTNNIAKNKLKVFFLHDSFGSYMAQYMNDTFSEITYYPYIRAFDNMSNFEKLIKEEKPDIILLTVVERMSLNFGQYLED